jgi:tRNA-binding protein
MSTHRIDPEGRPYAPELLDRKDPIDPVDFFAIDLRVGIVTAVDPFPEARKPAFKLTVDFGPRVGMLHTSAQVTNYAPDELVGRHVVGVVNLPPKRIAGFTSEFLVLGGLEADGTVRLLVTDQDLPPGSQVA